MNTRSLARAATVILTLSALISGCNSAQSDWAKAGQINTVSGYKDFLNAHPNDQHANEAQAMILTLQDDNAWAEAKNSGTVAAYQTYLQQSPEGAHAKEAHDAITTLDRGEAWKSAQGSGSVAAFRAFLQKYPTGPEADQANTELKQMAGYHVHLASESSNDKAQRKLSQLQARLREQASDLAITPDPSGKSFSIDSPGMTEKDAKSACEAIKKKHEACQVVRQ